MAMHLESVIVFSLFQVSFLLGYIMGRHSSTAPAVITTKNQNDSSIMGDEPTPTIQQHQRAKKIVSIDDSKFVTNFEENLQGNGKVLGNQTIVADDVSSSVSKLAQLKKIK